MSTTKTEKTEKAGTAAQETPGATGKSAKFRITIYDAWCKKCGICVEFCPRGVLTSDPFGTPKVTFPERCIGCTQCVLHCPDFTITVSAEERKGDKAEE